MKKLLLLISLIGCVSGCASPPIYMVDDFHGKKITRCDNDAFCFQETYSVAWDRSGQSNCCKYRNNCNSHCNSRDSVGYPVSYRSIEYSYEEDHCGYTVTLPEGGNIAMPKDRVKEAGR
jgi:hypothetical protein